MSFAEVLPTARTLSRVDRLRLIEVLAQELGEDETWPSLEPGGKYPIWSPIGAYEAGGTMLRVLEETRE